MTEANLDHPWNSAPSPMASGPGGLSPSTSGLTAPVRPDFNGTGGELLVTYLVGLLLTMITFGIYLPWFVVKLRKFQYDNTMIKGLPGGQMRMAFTGTGGELFVRGLVGYLLTAITLGIYGPWFICNLIDYFAENTTFTTASGKQYRLNFKGKGGELFVTFLVGMILTGITFGIYAPWFSCKLQKWINNNIEIYEDGTELVGQADFVGTGGELFVVNLVGMLLTMITFGIYFPWFQVNLVKFNTHNTRINVKGRTIVPKFSGTGGELFVEFLVGYLLTLVTLGIYSPWWAVKLMKFNINNLSFEDVGQSAIGAGGAAGQLRA